MKLILLCIGCCIVMQCIAQPYIRDDGKTRHRFAQTVFGMDLQVSSGGKAFFLNASGDVENFNMKSTFAPRIYIAGTHFWGHAEFYFSIPLAPFKQMKYQNLSYRFVQSDIFGTKIYPWAIRKKKLRPFFGFTIAGLSYRQYTDRQDGFGPLVSRLRIPVLAGINYCTGKYLLEAGINYQYDPTLPYYLSRSEQTNIHTPPITCWIGIRKWFETTVTAEKNYLNGTTRKHFDILAKSKKLNSWFFGFGPSSAFYTNRFSYNRELFPFMDKPFAVIFPEASTGYFYQPFGVHVAAVFRYNTTTLKGYGISQTYKRTAFTVEGYKYMFDYHGFTPFVGACISLEFLGFSQKSPGATSISSQRQLFAPGVLFGWDILPDKLQGITLRTNIRYFQNLWLEPIPGKKVILNQLEFNFIQLIIYPQRIRNFRAAWQKTDLTS